MTVGESKNIVRGLVALLSIGDRVDVYFQGWGRFISCVVYDIDDKCIYVRQNGRETCLFKGLLSGWAANEGFFLHPLNQLAYIKW